MDMQNDASDGDTACQASISRLLNESQSFSILNPGTLTLAQWPDECHELMMMMKMMMTTTMKMTMRRDRSQIPNPNHKPQIQTDAFPLSPSPFSFLSR